MSETEPTQAQVEALYDTEVRSVDGDRLGPVRQVYLDERTGAPTWVTVRTGWFHGREHAVPLEGSEPTGHGIRVAVSGEEVREAPTMEEGERLDDAHLAELYGYYGLVVGAGEGATTEAGGAPPRVRRHVREGGPRGHR